ncbi:MAG: ABC transporter permease [Propionibacteriaceae bacterium]|jgi:NitT/TauT family transport system permease protein|nr:ABC transporter permease [Propionibacteriaceae bacterium]
MRRHTSWLTLVAPVCLGALLLAAWTLAVAPGTIPRYFLPTPWGVLEELAAGLISPGDMWPYIGATVLEAVLGSAAGFLIALPLAVLIYRSRLVSAAVLPFLGASQAIPAIALAPLLVLWVGYGLGGIVVLCTLMVFFPILVSSVVGFRHINTDVLGAAQLDGAGSWALLIHMEIPMALHNILAGTRNGFTLSVTGAVVGEMVMGGSGLGSLIASQRDSFNTAGMFATILVLATVAAAIYSVVAFAERRWSRTSSSARSSHVRSRA